MIWNDDQRVDIALQFLNPGLGRAHPVAALEMKRLGHTPTVRILPRQHATTGAAPVPVPPPMPAVMKTMLWSSNLAIIWLIASSAAARPTSASNPRLAPGDGLAKLDALVGVGQLKRQRRYWRQ